MSPEIDPTVDYAFKRLFGTASNAALLIDLLNAVAALSSGRSVREVTIQNPFTEMEFENDKQAIVDIRAKDQTGRQFLLEMQKLVPWYFPNRILFNWATAYAEQMQQGDYHATLLPTLALCILSKRLIDDEEVHHIFRLVDAKREILFCKDVEIHTIELSKFRSTAEQVETPIERWCYFLKYAMEMDPEALPEQLKTPAIVQAMEVLMRIRESEQDRQAYITRRMNEADIATREYVSKHAHEIGEAEGVEKGIAMGKIHFAQRLLKQPLTTKGELERLTLDDLTALADQLEQQLLPLGDAP
jgi:predicted transposase/invertase (TIGR01784 family)